MTLHKTPEQSYEHITYFSDGKVIFIYVYANQIILVESLHEIELDKKSIKFAVKDSIINTGENYNKDQLHLIELSDIASLTTREIIASLDALYAVYSYIHTIRVVNSNNAHVGLYSYQAPTPTNTNSDAYQLWLMDGYAHRKMFYQSTSVWLIKSEKDSYPVSYKLTEKFYHPTRPQKSVGIVYQRYIPWLSATLSFRVFSMDDDLERFSNWMNDPIVDDFWEESGDIAKHKAYIQQRLTPASSTLPLICCIGSQPIGYFEVYWAKEDRIASYYNADDFDRGWHVLIGEAAYRGRPYVTAWMPSISHYLLIDDARTQSVVIEPRIDNQKMQRSLSKCGYAHIKTFDFPHKTAMLGKLSREHFFNTCGLLPKIDAIENT